MSRTVNELYAFGEFTLDPAKRRLLRDQETVALAPKVLDTLVALVEGRGRVMEKDELMREVWGATIVEEVGLAKNISLLRKALGEGLGEHRFIVTVPGRGYRFVADVSVVPANGGPANSVPANGIAPEETGQAADAADAVNDRGAVEVSAPPARPWTRQPRIAAGIGLTVLVVALSLGASAWWFRGRTQPPALTDRDTILLANFVNRTGDAIFDGTLRQALAAQLEQSPFFDLFSDVSARERLRMLGFPPEAGLSAEAAREICRREGLQAFVSGTIAPLGSHYAIMLDAIDHNGDVLAREQTEAVRREDVLTALAAAARGLRQRLGESLHSIARFRGDLTTSSLEALKAQQQGTRLANRGEAREAIKAFQAAIALDPNFAAAYMGLALAWSNLQQRTPATQAVERAYALRDHASEWERLRITENYYLIATGELDKLIDALELHRRTYPRDAKPYAALAAAYLRAGRSENAVAAAREALDRKPGIGAAISTNLARGLLRLNRFDELRRELDHATQQLKYDTDYLWNLVYTEAFVRGDAERMQRVVAHQNTRSTAYLTSSWQANAAAFAGQRRHAEELSRQVLALASRNEGEGSAMRAFGQIALRAAILGDCSRAKASATQVLESTNDDSGAWQTPLALVLCGDAARAQAAVDAQVREHPKDTVLNAIWKPVIVGALELQRGNPEKTIALLEGTTRYEAAAEFWPQHLRGLAYLRLRKDREAAAEFRKIIGARGQGALSPLYPLAHLHLARALSASGDAAGAHESYQQFFALWKDADADLPMLLEAKREAQANRVGS